jgi:hypothetical protein
MISSVLSRADSSSRARGRTILAGRRSPPRSPVAARIFLPGFTVPPNFQLGGKSHLAARCDPRSPPGRGVATLSGGLT